MEKSDKEKQQQQGNPMSLPLRPRGSDEPWLVFFHGKREQNQTFYSISEDHNHLKNMPCLRRKVVCACSHGWMVLTARSFDRCYGCCIVNPATLEKIQLPPVDFHFNKCVLSLSPTNSSCTVLFITSPRCDVITFRFSCPKKSGNVDRWIKQEVKFEDSGGITDATSCDGKVYGLTRRFDDILIIEAADTTTLTVRKMGIKSWLPSLKESLPINVVLVESCGELYAIRRIYAEQYKPQEIQDFEVFKLHFSRKSWERVKSLGNRAFFLGRNSRCSASAKESDSDLGIMGNTIYFTMNADRSLYAFNLEEKSVSVSLPCPNVHYNWSEPNWMLLSCSEE